MSSQPDTAGDFTDVITLRFVGENEDGTDLHELRASHVAEVLQGLVGLSSDFAKAGAFGDGPAGSEVLVRPAKEGSFLMDVYRIAADIQEGTQGVGLPGLGAMIWWATRKARAEVSGVEYLENGNVVISWQDNTIDVVPLAVWEELEKRTPRRKKQLRQILAPLSDSRVVSLEVEAPNAPPGSSTDDDPTAPPTFTLDQDDYDAVRPEADVIESFNIFEAEAQMSAIDFDDPGKWKVKTTEGTRSITRSATVEDAHFLGLVSTGLAIRKTDIFWLKIREDVVETDGRRRTRWTVLEVKSHRRSAVDDDA